MLLVLLILRPEDLTVHCLAVVASMHLYYVCDSCLQGWKVLDKTSARLSCISASASKSWWYQSRAPGWLVGTVLPSRANRVHAVWDFGKQRVATM